MFPAHFLARGSQGGRICAGVREFSSTNFVSLEHATWMRLLVAGFFGLEEARWGSRAQSSAKTLHEALLEALLKALSRALKLY